jgi:ABC-type antimicrobial peptide transport system, permease component
MNIWLSEIWRAWRAMFRRPGYLLLATGVLALGISASVAVGVLINAVLLRPLPYPQPSRLVKLGMEKMGVAYWISPQEYQHMLPLDGVESVGLIARSPASKNIASGGEPALVPALLADHGLLPTLGVKLSLGRNFSVDEDRPHGPNVVILSHGFWLRRYGGDVHVLGQSIAVEGVPTTIIGVLPEAVDFNQADLLLPLALEPNSTDDGGNYRAVARLAPGASAKGIGSQLQVRLHAMHQQFGGPFVDYFLKQHYRADDLQTALRVNARPVLMMFLSSALALLLIAVVNLTNLVMLRTLSRGHDAAVRHALGASWWRRALPALAEGSLIGVGGIVAGCMLAALGLASLRGLIPPSWLAGSRLDMSAPLLLMGSLIGMLSVITAVALGLWRAQASLSLDELREGGRSGLSRRSGLLGRGLVVVQVALASALLCAGGLFLHALYDAAHVPLGFATRGVLTFELSPVQARYPDAAAIHLLTSQLLERLRAEPGVESATVATGLPAGDMSQNLYIGSIHTAGVSPLDIDTPQFRAVGPRFFDAFTISMREGRRFDANDRQGSERVAIVNQRLAQQMFAGHALGKTIDYTAPSAGGGAQSYSLRVVGVIGTISPFGPLGAGDNMLYVPFSQMPDGLLALYRQGNPLRFALRVHGDPDGYRAALARVVATVAPNQPVANVRSMRRIVHETSDGARLNLLLVGVFGALALLLAAAGIYAVVAVMAAAREREFGVRLALGASPARLARTVLVAGVAQVLLGLAIGLMLSLALSGVLRSVLVQINRNIVDPPVLLGVCGVLLVVGSLSCLGPALRAARVHPMRALRGE